MNNIILGNMVGRSPIALYKTCNDECLQCEVIGNIYNNKKGDV